MKNELACRRMQGILVLMAYDEADLGQRQNVLSHIATCPSCASQVDELHHLRTKLHAAIPSPRLTKECMARVRATVRTYKTPNPGRSRFLTTVDFLWRHWLVSSLGTATAIVLLIVASLPHQPIRPSTVPHPGLTSKAVETATRISEPGEDWFAALDHDLARLEAEFYEASGTPSPFMSLTDDELESFSEIGFQPHELDRHLDELTREIDDLWTDLIHL